MPCVFCDALTNERDRIVYQDEHVFVLVNIEPIKFGHVMVLPVRHAELPGDLTDIESKKFLNAVTLCMQTMGAIDPDSPICLINGGVHRTQPHLHAHVLPSKKHLRGLFSAAEGLEERKRADAETLKRIADEFKKHL